MVRWHDQFVRHTQANYAPEAAQLSFFMMGLRVSGVPEARGSNQPGGGLVVTGGGGGVADVTAEALVVAPATSRCNTEHQNTRTAGQQLSLSVRKGDITNWVQPPQRSKSPYETIWSPNKVFFLFYFGGGGLIHLIFGKSLQIYPTHHTNTLAPQPHEPIAKHPS